MLLRAAMLKSAGDGIWCRLGLTRVPPAVTQPVPLGGRLVDPTAALSAPPPTLFPELGLDPNSNSFTIDLPSSYVGESMELAVPKRKVSHSKKRKRNAAKALKPIPVIIRCRVCGRVKLPHFFCCGGRPPTPKN